MELFPAFRYNLFIFKEKIKRISTAIPNATDARIEDYRFKPLERFLMIF